jgi:hypothetical protein
MTELPRRLPEDSINNMISEAVGRMRAIDISDPELAHSEADKIVAAFLRQLGAVTLAEEYEAIPKWYA